MCGTSETWDNIYGTGIFARNNVEETGDAIEDEECGVVDEAKAVASRLPAKGAAVREAAVGGDAWG